MPSPPYFHGDEDLYVIDGVLVAHTPPRVNRHGVPLAESAKVLTLDKRYSLGMWMRGERFTSACCWRTSKGDTVRPATLEALIGRCHETFGGRPRYAVKEISHGA